MNSISIPINQFSKEEKTTSCKTLTLASCTSVLVIGLIAAVISYFVFGIMFLVQDYDTTQECHGSNLWTYVLVTLILGICNGNSAKNSKDNDSNQLNICSLLCILVLNISMSIWGNIEIYSNSCDDLKTTQLYTFAQFVFVCTYISSVMLSCQIIWIITTICCCNHADEFKNSSNLSKQLTFKANKNETLPDTHTIV